MHAKKNYGTQKLWQTGRRATDCHVYETYVITTNHNQMLHNRASLSHVMYAIITHQLITAALRSCSTFSLLLQIDLHITHKAATML
jgi:hypothetical protein